MATLKIQIEQNQFIYSTELVQKDHITLLEATKFLVLEFQKYIHLQRLLISNSKKRPVLNKPFTMIISNENNERLITQEIKISAFTETEQFNKGIDKIYKIFAIAMINADELHAFEDNVNELTKVLQGEKLDSLVIA